MPKILTIFVVFLIINFEQIGESIKICLDKSGPGGMPSECPQRKELCDHPIYKNFMTEQCPKSCGRCALALTNAENVCRDNIGPSGISDCPKYQERCNDRIWGDFMRAECPFTCGLCNRTKLTLKPFKPRQISKQTTKQPPSASTSIQAIGENSQPIPPILSQLPSRGCISLDCSLNLALDPCDDFFEFVCYGFTKNIENLPDGFTTKSQFNILWSQSYRTLIALLNDQNLRQINGQNPFLRQMFLFYDSCRDKQKREIQKSDGLFAHLKEANFNAGQIHSFDTDWMLNAFPFVPFFSLKSTWDVRPETTTKSMFLFKPAQTFANVGELKDEETRQKLAQKLTKILRTLLEDELAKGQQEPIFFGKESSPQDYETQIQRRVDNFIQMELQIRQAYDSYQGPDLDNQFADLRLPIKYLTLDQIGQSFLPQINWLRILQSLSLETGLDQNTQLVALGEELLISFGQLIERIQRDNPQMMSDYLDWALIWRILKELDSRFVELMDSWAKNDWSCVRNFVRIYFAHWLDRLYLGNSFDKSVIPENERILSYLKAAFSIVLDEAEWMGSGTKQKAHEKLAQLKTQIAYYSLVEDDQLLEKLYANYGLVEGMPWAQMFARVHRQYFLWPTLDYRASYWVDGYYMWVFNSLAIYGALIHSPWYDPANPIVFNFGAMGTFIGHELTHGYDSNGWHFDGQGNRRRPEDLDQGTMERMEQRMDCFVGQYERYEGERKRANPRFTLSENIADNGAIRASYKAWLQFKAENREEVEGSRKPVGLEHFSDDQLFFISSAFMYCTGMPESDAETFAREDNHGFPRARVNLPLRNFDKFAQTFQCPIGSKMNPNEAERCQLW